MKVTTNPDKARAILTAKIESGRASALKLFERVHAEAPRDALVKGSALAFFPATNALFPATNALPVAGQGGFAVGFGGRTIGIHKHALGQMAQRAGIPTAYIAGLAATTGWQSDLAATLLGRHFNVGEARSRFLVRAVNNEARGFLSDKYRRLDSRPLVEAFAGECKRIGAVPIDGTVSDTRVALKAIVPTLYEPVQGEVMAFGIEWHNSDFGAGTHALRAFMFRLWCENGATMENALAQVHLGGKLSDDIELSQRTFDLDTKTSISALRDVVTSVLAPTAAEKLCAGIRAADEKEIDWRSASNKIGRRLLKGELDAAKAAFEGDDVVNLPAGKSVWRASNALSWIAGQTEDADRKLELQRLAGELLNGKTDVEAAA